MSRICMKHFSQILHIHSVRKDNMLMLHITKGSMESNMGEDKDNGKKRR